MQENLIYKNFQNSVNKFGSSICLQFKQNEAFTALTYKEVETLSLKIANFLIISGIKPNDKVALLSENCYQWPIVYLAINFCGACAVPIDPQIKKRELENILMDSGAKTIFISEKIYNGLKDNFENIENYLSAIILIDNKVTKEKYSCLSGILDTYGILKDAPIIDDRQFSSILYTSGTTANPKAVCISHYNFCSDAKNILKLNINKPQDNYISILPLYHTYAFMATFIVPIFSGARITFISDLNLKEIISTIKETKVTILVAVPQIFNLIHKAIFDKIKHQNMFNKFLFRLLLNLSAFLKINLKLNLGKNIFSKIHNELGKNLVILNSGGAKLNESIYSDLNKLGFNFLNGYGLTETSPVVSLLLPNEFKPGSVGRPIPGVEVKINNPDKLGIGEILIKGPNVMPGYYKRPDLTNEVIKDGWFYSGDLGYMDKLGYIYITARIKEVIVLSSGKNIYPEEIEALLLECPYIKEACVFSIGGEKEILHAAIVPNTDHFKQKNEINIKDKIRWELDNISKELATYKHIMSFSIEKNALPRTHLGKIKRYLIKEGYEKSLPAGQTGLASAQDESAHPLEAEQIQKKTPLLSYTANQIIEYLKKELGQKIDLSDHLEIDLGIDSLSRVELFMGLEKLMKLNMPIESMADIFTVEELILKVEKFKENPVTPNKTESSWAKIINELPKKEILRKVDLATGIFKKLILFFVKSSLFIIFKIFWKIKIRGRCNLPKTGPYILCPNHASYLDGIAIAVSLPINIGINTFFFGLSAYFEHKSLSWMARFLRVISIDPTTHLKDAMQAAGFVLKNKKIICIFPEGQRAINENIGGFKKGVGILAKELDVPLIPVYIKGSHFAWGRGDKFPKPYPITVTFGKPLTWQELKQAITTPDIDEYQAIADGIKEEVAKLASVN